MKTYILTAFAATSICFAAPAFAADREGLSGPSSAPGEMGTDTDVTGRRDVPGGAGILGNPATGEEIDQSSEDARARYGAPVDGDDSVMDTEEESSMQDELVMEPSDQSLDEPTVE